MLYRINGGRVVDGVEREREREGERGRERELEVGERLAFDQIAIRRWRADGFILAGGGGGQWCTGEGWYYRQAIITNFLHFNLIFLYLRVSFSLLTESVWFWPRGTSRVSLVEWWGQGGS